MQDGTKNTNHPTSEFELLLFRIRINMLKSFTKKKNHLLVTNEIYMSVRSAFVLIYYSFLCLHIFLCVLCVFLLFSVLVYVWCNCLFMNLKDGLHVFVFLCVYCNIWVYMYTSLCFAAYIFVCVSLHAWSFICTCSDANMHFYENLHTCMFNPVYAFCAWIEICVWKQVGLHIPARRMTQ